MPKNSKGIRCSNIINRKRCTGRTAVVLVRRTVADNCIRRRRQCKLCGKTRSSIEMLVDD